MNSAIKLTRETHLTASGQHGLEHFTDFYITESAAYSSTQTIMNHGHDSEQHNLVAGGIAGLKLAV
jgi:hypothetical protein